MGRKVGYNWKVCIGTWSIADIASVSFDGMTVDEIDVTQFGDTWKQFDFALKDGGTISIEGNYNPADTTGQRYLEEAALFNSQLTSLRIYQDNTSYWTPNQTTGYFSPQLTNGAPTNKSYVLVRPPKISADASGIGKISVEFKVSGCLALV